MAGRPRKPILVAAIDGDTRKKGTNKHAEAIAGAMLAQRGIPDMPDFTPPPKATAAQKRVLADAAEHWQYLAGELSREGMLSTADGGMLTQAATIYAMSMEAFRSLDFSGHALHSKTYMQIADRMGLNESARAKFPAKKPEMTDIQSAMFA